VGVKTFHKSPKIMDALQILRNLAVRIATLIKGASYINSEGKNIVLTYNLSQHRIDRQSANCEIQKGHFFTFSEGNPRCVGNISTGTSFKSLLKFKQLSLKRRLYSNSN